MPGKFETKKAKDGQTYFHLKAGNGEIILVSEMYKAKSSALNGIESVKKNAPIPERYDKLTSRNGKHYFTLKAANHEVIGTSEMYESEEGLQNGIASVMQNAPTASIVDVEASA